MVCHFALILCQVRLSWLVPPRRKLSEFGDAPNWHRPPWSGTLNRYSPGGFARLVRRGKTRVAAVAEFGILGVRGGGHWLVPRRSLELPFRRRFLAPVIFQRCQ